MKILFKIPLYILFVLCHFIVLGLIIITYPYSKIKYILKPNLNNRPFIYRSKLVKTLTFWIDDLFKKII